jgi:hypothetical protein
MLLLGAIMAAERRGRGGARLTQLLGLILILWAVTTLTG